MASDKQIKINENLHNKVKEYVDADDSEYSSYKSFYEQAAKDHLEREKAADERMDEEQVKIIEKIIDQKLEQKT